MRRPWTALDCFLLRVLLGSGVSMREAAEALGRPRGSVSNKAHRLRISQPTTGRRWTFAETTRLHRLFHLGRSHGEIARDLGRSTECVAQKIRKLRCKGAALPVRPPGRRRAAEQQPLLTEILSTHNPQPAARRAERRDGNL